MMLKFSELQHCGSLTIRVYPHSFSTVVPS